MIKGRCRTNLDGYDCSAVSVFAEIPKKGELITVRFNGESRELSVVQITHSVTDFYKPPAVNGSYSNEKEPFIIVELHNPIK